MTRSPRSAPLQPEPVRQGHAVWTTREAVKAFSWSRFLMLAALLLTQLFTLLGVLWVSHLNSERVVRMQSQGALKQLVQVATDSTQNYLQNAARMVQISKVMWQVDQKNLAPNPDLAPALQSLLSTAPQMSGAMLGQSSGDFTFVERNGQDFLVRQIVTQPTRRVTESVVRGSRQSKAVQVKTNFDPRTRPWFIMALAAKGQTIWTAPYIFSLSQMPGITVASTIGSGPEPTVMAIDLQLRGLTKFLQGVQFTPGGRAFIVDQDGHAIAASRAWPMQIQGHIPLLSQVADPPLQVLIGRHKLTGPETENLVRFKVSGKQYGAVLRTFEVQPGTRWTVGVYAPESDFTEDINRLYRQQLWIILLVAFLSAALIWPLAFQATRPLATLQQQASTDALTGLTNRASFLAHLRESLQETPNLRGELGVVILDLDGFKNVNDTFGHAAGDEVLASIGQRLRTAVRSGDMLSRLGGDEFAFLLQGSTRETVKLRAENLVHDLINQSIVNKGIEHHLGATAGLAFREKSDDEDAETLMFRADRALIRGKRQAKGRVWISGESGSTLLD